MKTLVEINGVSYGSTGNIMKNIASVASNRNYKTFCFVGHEHLVDESVVKFTNKFSLLSSVLFSKFGFDGRGSILSTYHLVNYLKKIKPDIIHIHNIHGYYLNYDILFKYLRNEFNGQIVWTFHDCWPMTGQCTHFDYINCEKWLKQCYDCPLLELYPSSYFDRSYKNYNYKKKLFTDFDNLTIVSPSEWLIRLAKKSYFHSNKFMVINNGINLNSFKKYDVKLCDDIFDKYNIPKDKKILLGVSSAWTMRKGIDVFHKLSSDLPSDYIIILVGYIDSNFIKKCDNIIYIGSVDNKDELSKIYSISNFLVNPTREDNFPTINIESIACGTPVVCYNTGGCSEIVNENCGFVVKKDNYDLLLSTILDNIDFKLSDKCLCITESLQYNMYDKFNEYVDLFDSLISK